MYKNLSVEGLGVSGRQSEIIELALSFGFKGIDLDLADFSLQVKTLGLPHARRFIDSARLKIGAIRLPLVWDETDEIYQAGLPQFSESIKLAAEIGCKRAVTALAPANDIRPYHENFEFHRRRLAEIGELLGAAGMRLGVEFVAPAAQRRDRAYQFIHTFEAAATLVNMVRSANVGIVVDVWQIIAGGGTLDEVRKMSPERIVAAHLSDPPLDTAAADLTDADRCLPGETGRIDAAAALALLAELGFDGPVTPKAHRSRLQGQRREQIVKLAGQRLDQAWQAAGIGPSGKLLPAKR